MGPENERVASLPASEQLRLDYASLPAMVWTLTADGSCDHVNARWLEFTGRQAAAELGDGWADRLHPEDRAAALSQIRTAIAQRTPFQTEFRMRRHDGVYRWLLDIGAPRFGRDGAFLGVVGVATDVTDRRQLEQRLGRAERAQAIGQLAGGIAHDFNNLLTGIIGHVAMLQEEPGLSALAREDLAQIQRSADRAASLTRQLLAFSRRQVLAPRVLDLNQLVVGCLSTLRRLVGARIQVVWAPASHLDAIVADPNQLEHVLTQLTTNARESMPDGGTLELSTRQEPLDGPRLTRLAGQRPGIYVTLQVRDSGRGMDAATLERIFEPFFSTKLRERGRGARPRERLRHHQAERGAHRRRERARSRHHVHDLLPAARGERPRGFRRGRVGGLRRGGDDPPGRGRGAGAGAGPPGARACRLHRPRRRPIRRRRSRWPTATRATFTCWSPT